MALGTPTQLGFGGDSVAEVTTTTFLPTANALLIALAVARRTDGTISTPTITDTSGLVWASVATQVYDPGTGLKATGRIYRSQAPALPVNMSVTATTPNAFHTAIAVCQVTGADYTLTNENSSQSVSTGTPSVTLPQAPASGLVMSAFFETAGSAAPNPTPGSFTEILDAQATGAGLRLQFCYSTSNPTTFAWSTARTNPTFGFGFEVKLAPSLQPIARGTAGTSTAVGAATTTGSFTANASARLFAIFAARRGSSAVGMTQPTITDTASLSWTELADAQITGTVPNTRLVLWTAVAPSTPTSMTVTGQSAESSSAAVTVMEVADADTDFTNVATNTSLAGAPAITLPSAPAATSAVLAWSTFSAHTSGVATPTNFTQIDDFVVDAAGDALATWVGYDSVSPGSSVAWTTTGTNSVGIALEVKIPSAAPSGLTGQPSGGWIG